MDGGARIELRRAEISLNNFNEVAVPHHLNLLDKHKNNIYKYYESNDLRKIKNEHINAARVVTQLRHLLEEIDGLRQKIIERDVQKFDHLTEQSKQNTIKAINEYIELLKYSNKKLSNINHDNEDSFKTDDNSEHSSLQVGEIEMNTLEKESLLKSFENLNDEVRDIYELFIKLEEMVKEQAEPIGTIEDNIMSANLNVEVATAHLKQAEYYKTKWYPIAGAIVGGCIAGPIGLLTGMKIGGLAFVGGSILGFTGGKILKNQKNGKPELNDRDNDKKIK